MEAIARICRESYEPYDARLQPADLQLFHAEFHAQNMNDPATRWVVLCQDGVPVGVAQWRMLPGVAHLHMLFVAGSAQGRGYGVRLLKHHQKEALREQIEARAAELGLDGFYDKIADETIATDIETLTPWLEEVKHPALEMEPLL